MIHFSAGTRMRSTSGPLLAIVFLFGLAACTERPTPETDPGEAPVGLPAYGDDPIENGRVSYATFCASCHGIDGHGDGPVTEVLTEPPPDLTTLTQRYDGAYPGEYVYDVIDGSGEIAAHGSREMPVWGNIWRDPEVGGMTEEVADMRVRELVEYLRAIQAE